MQTTIQLEKLLPGLRTWLERGVWTVVDRGFFAGTNFLMNLFLARWLQPASYGAFSTAYSVYLLLLVIHTALWTEPMLVYGGGRFADSFRSYERILVHAHWRLSGLGSLGCVLIAIGVFFMGQGELALSFLGLAVATPLILYLWLVSRSAYVVLVPKIAAYGSGAYLVLYLAGGYALHLLGWLNAASALMLMGFAGFLTARGVRSQLRRLPSVDAIPLDSRNIQNLHLKYGRWALLAGVFSWVPFNWYFVLAPMVLNLEASGSLRAYVNFLYPLLQFLISFSPLLVTIFAKKVSSKQLLLLAALFIGFMWTVSIAYSGLLVLLRDQAVSFVYGGKYADVSAVIPYVAPTLIGASVAVVLNSLLRARERVHEVSVVYLANALLTVSLGTMLFYRGGLTGFAIALAVVQLGSAVLFSTRIIPVYKAMRNYARI